MEIICGVHNGQSIERYLKHVGLSPIPPPIFPARFKDHELGFEENELADNCDRIIEYD